MPFLCVQVIEQRIQSMRRTVAEIQKCKPDLCLPDKSEETLTVFTVVDQLQSLLLELEKVGQSVSQSVSLNSKQPAEPPALFFL